MDNTRFICATPKCNNFVVASDLPAMQLKSLQFWLKECSQCKKTTKWTEQGALLAHDPIEVEPKENRMVG